MYFRSSVPRVCTYRLVRPDMHATGQVFFLVPRVVSIDWPWKLQAASKMVLPDSGDNSPGARYFFFIGFLFRTLLFVVMCVLSRFVFWYNHLVSIKAYLNCFSSFRVKCENSRSMRCCQQPLFPATGKRSNRKSNLQNIYREREILYWLGLVYLIAGVVSPVIFGYFVAIFVYFVTLMVTFSGSRSAWAFDNCRRYSFFFFHSQKKTGKQQFATKHGKIAITYDTKTTHLWHNGRETF